MTAIAVAPVVAAGLVIAPHTSDIAVPRSVPTIQPQTLAVELTSATVHISTENTALARAAAAPPQANVTGAQLRNAVGYVAITAALIGLTPVWYAAFPVTIPASVAATALFDVVIHAFGGTITRPEGLTPLGSGLAGWAVGPLYLVKKAVRVTGKYLNSLVAPPSSSQPTAATIASRTVRPAHQTKSGLAGTHRTTRAKGNTARTPSAHRTAKPAHVSENKKRTAGSGRSTDKH
ncbi:hypothetical protein H7J51_20480 [Mycobacterium crocinum]|uniref:Uncharacterized protein n=1 Tax=Mycolicibacterium crocinum TaxID=388459 RepID=A0ABY3TTQ6_9MYCO|nr:hypothetical protein [Mycolicibacterium crocinum]MCV7217658.1 hypothetical protein [Mycolicibacterium crocinum]ULN42530.1 hypothetical protein MI149_05270 [Mycolicibacterium crocinum]